MAQHQIVVSGPYRFTRHPAYAGMIIANAGIFMYFLNSVAHLSIIFILVPAIFLRIVIEERTLFGIEGTPNLHKNESGCSQQYGDEYKLLIG